MQLNLPELLRQKEGEQLDYKQRITSLEKIAKTLCAFANTHGGVLLVGIKDDHSITGVDPEEEKFMLQQAAEQFCQPEVALHFMEMEDDEERTVLLVQINESNQKPHKCRNKQGVWQVYVRHQDKSIPAGKQLVKQLVQQFPAEVAVSAPLTKHERSVLEYIDIHQRITVKQLMVLLNFSKRRAQRLLHDMQGKGIVRVFEHEQEEFYG